MALLRYFAELRPGKIVLWCYLIWYLVTAVYLFDPSPALWSNSIGISLVIGVALSLSVGAPPTDTPGRRREARWQTFRLFLMPFCVSSFSSLIKGQGYWLVFPARTDALVTSVLGCVVFVSLVRLLRQWLPASA